MIALVATMCLAALHGDALLVSTNQLANVTDVLVVDARSPEAYAKGHIPGAVNLDVDTLSENKGDVAGVLKPFSVLRRLLSKAGVDPSKHLVVYSGMDSVGDFKAATRLFWILEYVGYERVSVLDGGFAKWKAENRDVAKGAPDVEPVDIPKLEPRADRIATYKEVQEAIKNGDATIEDLRSPAYFSGEKKADVVKKAGHIPSANNMPADAFLSDTDRTVKPATDLDKLTEEANVKPETPVITYCNTGRSASVGYFIMRRTGHDNVSLYDGSMSEWTNKRKPVETDTEKK